PGELRSRADRMFTFDDLAAVTATLDRLPPPPRPPPSEHGQAEPNAPGPLVPPLPRQPGSREARYAHLLGDPRSADTTPHAPAASLPEESSPSRVHELEAQLAALQSLVKILHERIDAIEAKLEPGSDPNEHPPIISL